MKIGRILFGPAINETKRAVEDRLVLSHMDWAIKEAKIRHYREGMADGVILALEALLGHAPEGAEPYRGPMPLKLREWAGAALERARKERMAKEEK